MYLNKLKNKKILSFVFLFSCFCVFFITSFFIADSAWAKKYDCCCGAGCCQNAIHTGADECNEDFSSESNCTDLCVEWIKKKEKAESTKTSEAESSNQGGLLTGISCAGKDGATCELNEFAQVAVNVAKWILGIVGSLALLMFVYGGITLMISGGNSEKVTQGRQIIIGAVVGLAIVFASYMIITFALKALGIEADWATPMGMWGKK